MCANTYLMNILNMENLFYVKLPTIFNNIFTVLLILHLPFFKDLQKYFALGWGKFSHY